MRFALYTMHSATLKDMVAITVPNKTEYCRLHGYAYSQALFDGRRHVWPGYDRIPHLIDLLKSGVADWVFWLGADCLITNFSIRLEELTDRNFGMVMATDATEVQMDSFLVQPGRGGLELMQAIWNSRRTKYGANYEQSNLADKMKLPRFASTVKLLPQRAMNSYNYALYPKEWGPHFATQTDQLNTDGNWHPGDFVFHVPGMALDAKLSELRRMNPKVEKELKMESNVKQVVCSELSVPAICMLTCHDCAYQALAEKTVYQNKAEYAKRWGYDLFTLTGVDPQFADSGSHVNGLTWDRLRVALKIAKQKTYEWLYLVGADTLITNMTIPLSNLIDDRYHFIIASDFNEWNADSFFIRCTPEGIAYMEEVMAQYDRLKCHPIVEQQGMIELRDKHRVWKALPQRQLNAYNMSLYFPDGSKTTNCVGEDGNWQPGDFLIHWAGQPLEVRMRELEKVWPQIVR